MSRTVRSAAQLGLFGDAAPQQAELFDDGPGAAPAAPVVSKGPPSTREEHHAAMLATLAFLRGCDACPWVDWQVRYETGLFRLRSEWFPPEVAEPLIAALRAEAERLDFAGARPDPVG